MDNLGLKSSRMAQSKGPPHVPEFTAEAPPGPHTEYGEKSPHASSGRRRKGTMLKYAGTFCS